MRLIDLYVSDVGRRLPEEIRLDIEAELRSLLEDMLEDRAKMSDRPADEEMANSLLKEYGPPAATAAAYLPPRYLVGPELFPTYLQVLKIVLVVVLVLAALGFGLAFSQSGRSMADLGKAVAEGIAGILNAGIQVVGLLTIIFAIIQFAHLKGKESSGDWDPSKLKPIEDTDRIKRGDVIAGIVFTFIAIIALNFFTDFLGLYHKSPGSPLTFTPVLTEAFLRYLPYITLLLGLDILMNIYILIQGNWQKGTRWFAILINAATVVLLVIMMMGPAIVQLLPSAYSGSGMTTEQAAQAQSGLEIGMYLVLGVILAANLIDLGKKLWRMFGKQAPILNA